MAGKFLNRLKNNKQVQKKSFSEMQFSCPSLSLHILKTKRKSGQDKGQNTNRLGYLILIHSDEIEKNKVVGCNKIGGNKIGESVRFVLSFVTGKFWRLVHCVFTCYKESWHQLNGRQLSKCIKH